MEYLEQYKFSMFNHKVFKDGKLFLYNAYSGGFCMCDDIMKKTFKDVTFVMNPKEILQNLPQKYITELMRGRFIVRKDLDELKLIKSKHYLYRFSTQNVLNLTLIPTHACNFRCPYCFEADKEYHRDKMSEEVMSEIIKLINDKLNDKGTLTITWFGGEPLLALDIIEKLQRQILEIVNEKHLTFNSGIITNGYLLTKSISDKLVDLGVSFAQITLDGDREMHNTKRCLLDGKEGTFDRILENIKSSNEKLRLSIRINIDHDNENTISTLIDYLAEINLSQRENISFYFAIVKDFGSKQSALCSYLSVKEFSEVETELFKYAESKGIYMKAKLNPNIGLCGSLSPNTIVVEPNGKLQKCWGLVGNPDTFVGDLLHEEDEDANLCNQVKWYAWSPFEKEECQNCNIFPLCMGGCPLYTIEEDMDDSFKCSTYRFNLEKILGIMAEQYLKKTQLKEN